MQVKEPCKIKDTNTIIINCICTDNEDIEKLMKYLNSKEVFDFDFFNLDDNDHLTIFRNGDYLEPDGKADRF